MLDLEIGLSATVFSCYHHLSSMYLRPTACPITHAAKKERLESATVACCEMVEKVEIIQVVWHCIHRLGLDDGIVTYIPQRTSESSQNNAKLPAASI